MSSRSHRLRLAVLVCLSLPALASAQSVSVLTAPPPSSSHKADRAEPGQPGGSRFSIGAGLGFGESTGSGLGGITTSLNFAGYNPVYAPVGTALLEYAATRHVRLMVGVNGSYSNRLRESKYQPSSGTRLDARWGCGVGLGIRWVLNPGGLVEVSPSLVLGVRRGHMEASGTANRTDSDTGQTSSYRANIETGSLGIDARLALTLERLLLDNLYLRVESSFLRAGSDSYSEIARADDRPDTRSSYTDFGMGWGLAGSLQLRLTF